MWKVSFRKEKKNVSHPLQMYSSGSHFLNHRGLATQGNLTSMKHILFVCFLKLGLKEELPGASWSYCVPGLVSQEQLRGKVPTSLFLAQKWAIIFGNTHRLAGANGCVCLGGGVWGYSYSIFILWLPTINVLFPSDAAFGLRHFVFNWETFLFIWNIKQLFAESNSQEVNLSLVQQRWELCFF